MKYVGSTLYPCAQLRAGKSQGSQATVKQSLIDVDVVRQQLLKGGPKIGQIVA